MEMAFTEGHRGNLLGRFSDLAGRELSFAYVQLGSESEGSDHSLH